MRPVSLLNLILTSAANRRRSSRPTFDLRSLMATRFKKEVSIRYRGLGPCAFLLVDMFPAPNGLTPVPHVTPTHVKQLPGHYIQWPPSVYIYKALTSI